MKFNKFLGLALMGAVLFTSCESDDNNIDNPEEEGVSFSDGVFVLNEGGFGSGNSSVTYIDEHLETAEQNIFNQQNAGKALGDVAQSMGLYGDYAFIVVNVSNKVEVVDRHSFEIVATIEEGLENPRYVAFDQGKAYVTNWGDGYDSEDDFLSVIDLESFEVEKHIPVAEGPEEIVVHNGKLYVGLKGGYSYNNKIAVIDPVSLETEEITVGEQPSSMEIENGFLWVASYGLPDYEEEEKAGSIAKIDLGSHEVVQEFSFPKATDHPGNLNVENGAVYYTLGTSVYSFDVENSSLPSVSSFELEGVQVLRNVELIGEYLFATSANSDFTGNGKVVIYDVNTGAEINTLEVGINPNGIYGNR